MAGAYTVPSPKIKHFSHPHELELSSFQYQQGLTYSSTLCSCCERTPSGEIYICRPCNFILHLSCSRFPQLITHGAHGNHILTLLHIPAYSSGAFRCNACGSPGNGFNYHCSSCRYDLHPMCAFMPLQFVHHSHACPLALTFKDPWTPRDYFFCNICRNSIGSNEWRYRCSKCNFDGHLRCTTAPFPAPAPVFLVQGGQLGQQLQHRPLFPGGNLHNQAGLTQSAHQQFSWPAYTVAPGMVPVIHGPPVVWPNGWIPSASTGHLGNVGPIGWIAWVIEGLVGGAVQQIGQNLVQDFIGGGEGGGGGGSSIFGSFFGDL